MAKSSDDNVKLYRQTNQSMAKSGFPGELTSIQNSHKMGKAKPSEALHLPFEKLNIPCSECEANVQQIEKKYISPSDPSKHQS